MFEKARIIRDLGSSDNRTALNAVSQLKKMNSEYSLVGKDFHRANLQGANISSLYVSLENTILTAAILENAILDDIVLDYANLDGANLKNASMIEVHLLGASLIGTELQGANISVGHLHAADFSNANLKGANLHNARMIEINFKYADLRDVELENANLTKANLEGAQFGNNNWGLDSEKGMSAATLPDGLKMKTIKDLDRFVNPNHPDFWRPKVPVSWGDGKIVLKKKDPSDLDLSHNINQY